MRIRYNGARSYIYNDDQYISDDTNSNTDRNRSDIPSLCRETLDNLTLPPIEIESVDNLSMTREENGSCLLYRLEEEGCISIFTSHLPLVYKEGDDVEALPTLIEIEIDGEGELDSRLRPYQVEAIQSFLKMKRGIVKLPTSGGKTWVLAEICRLFINEGIRILLTTSTKSLLYQMKEDFIEFGIDGEMIGLVGDSNRELDKLITIAIPDTLVIAINKSDKDICKLLRSIGLWALDECHTLCNFTGVLLSNSLTGTKYRLGVSATPWSNQGLTAVLYGIAGPIIYEMTESSAIDGGYIMQPKVHMHYSPKAWAPKPLLCRSYSHGVYNLLYRHLILKNDGRNKLIASIVSDCMSKKDGAVIVIVNKVNTNPNHPELLLPLIKESGYELPLCTGKSSTKELNRVIEGLRDGSIQGAMFGPGVMKEGVNIPSIKYLILCGAGSSDIALLQRVGRALRNKEGKDEVYIHDMYDQQTFFKGQAEKRLITYRDKYGLDSVTIYGKDL